MVSSQMEQLKQVMKAMMERGFAPKFDGSADPNVLREVVQAAQSHMALEPGVTFEKCTVHGIEAECAIPTDSRQDAVVIYIHGGGLICGNAETSRGFAGMLAGESHFPVYSFSYRLAPENPYPAAVDDCFDFYKEIVNQYENMPIFLIGESGGAYLCITTALKARDTGIKMPAGIVPYSPPIDFSGAIDRRFPGNKDFTVTPEGLQWLAQLYCRPEETKDPYVSPYYADFHGICPVYLAWDESESLAVDSMILKDKILAAGGEVYWKSYPDCFHAFATTGRGTPESYEVTEAQQMVKAVYEHRGPVYIRFGRSPIPVFHDENYRFEIGKAEILQEGTDVAVIANGIMVYEAIKAAKQLAEEGVSVQVINMATIKPLDEQAVIKAAQVCGKIVTAEEHNIHGGLGDAVASVLCEHYPVPMRKVGVQDIFGESGSAEELLEAYGLTQNGIVNAVRELLQK